MNELSSGILDDTLKNQELEKNLALQTKWDKSYDEAKKTIQEFKTQLRNAQDIKRVLIANLMREDIRKKISNNIAELKHFTISTKLLIDELKKFTISCNNNIS